VFAHLLAIAIVGLCQFAFTSVSEPMMCIPFSPPWDTLRYWLQSGRKQPLSSLFSTFDIQRFNATALGIVLLGIGLGWSIWLTRPLRLSVRFRVRTMMAIIAVLSIEITAGASVWKRWEQWDADQRSAPYPCLRYSMRQEIYIQTGDSLSVDVDEPLLTQPVHVQRTVNADGRIDLDGYGRVYVVGLTASEVQEKIISRLKTHLEDRPLVPSVASTLDSVTTVRINRK
jgi:hypothetical protein